MSWMNEEGEVQGTETFSTPEENLIGGVGEVDAQTKRVTLEESPLAFWTARTLTGEVDEVLVGDPRENHLISRSIRKGDEPDAKALARLLRTEELTEVYQPENDRRALYKQACSHYMDLRDRQRVLKQKIRSRPKRWGHLHIPGAKVFSQKGREAYLAELSHDRIRSQVESLYDLLDKAHAEKKAARRQFLELGRRYPETQEFQKIPGIGPINAHTFDAYVQTPRRFATKQKLWRYCKLGVRKHSSGGEQIRREKPDPAGHDELKALSHRAVKEALGGEDHNEVQASYRASVRRTGDETHARLNTQWKILATMWGLWRRGTAYNPKANLAQSLLHNNRELIYKHRWSIEIVFRWLKDRMQLDRFTSRDPTGIVRQTLTGLIVWGLLVIFNEGGEQFSPKNLWRKLQAAMHQTLLDLRRRYQQNLDPPA